MDAFLLARLALELGERWSGAWVQQAWQDLWGRLVLRLRSTGKGATAFLLLSPLPEAQGLGLLVSRPPCPPRPPTLAAYLRAHLTGGRLVSASCQSRFERAVEIVVRARNSTVRLVLEATGRRGNLCVVDEHGSLRAVWRRFGSLPGDPYASPPRPGGLRNPDDVAVEDLEGWMASAQPLHRMLQGISPTIGREIEYRAGVEGIPAAYRGVVDGYGLDGPVFEYPELLASVRMTHLGPAEACHREALFPAGERLERDLRRAHAARSERDRCSAEWSRKQKIERRLAKIREDLSRLPDASQLRREADALAAHLNQVPRHATVVTVPDPWTGEGSFLISLDPSLTPAGNLERLYDRARKAERARTALGARLAAAEAELSAPEIVEPAEDFKDRPRSEASGLPYRRYRSSDGWTLWVGRNARENDRLLREARPWDIWLHVREGRGAHVLVRLPGREARVPERTLLEAARLAARHSGRSEEASVEVMFVEAGRVRKPRGSSPGRVVVAGERTIRVRVGAGSPAEL